MAIITTIKKKIMGKNRKKYWFPRGGAFPSGFPILVSKGTSYL